MARQRIQLEITGDSRSVERAFRNAGRAGSTFGRTMKTIGKVAAGGFIAAMVGVGLALRRGFSELSESQKVAAQTAAVLRSTGGIANVSAKRVDKLATSLSRMSGVDDELIASGANMLLTFTNIRNGARKNDRIFDMATQTVLDMSVALGKDIPSTAIMVGKALNDLTVNAKGTITGWSALRRVGVQITPMMMAQAASMIELGNTTGAQLLLLGELNTEFGGSARAFGTTMPGAIGKLNNAIDEVLAAFATGFLPIILKVSNALTKKLADPAFVARVSQLGTLIGTKLYNAFQAISAWFDAHWAGIRAGFQTAVNIAQRLYGWFQKIANVTPGGAETLLGIIAGGILLSKLGLLNKLLLVTLTRMRLIGSASVAGGIGGKGGKGGRAGKMLPLAGLGPYGIALAGAAVAAEAAHKHFDEPNRVTAKQLRDPRTRSRIIDAIGRGGLARLDTAIARHQPRAPIRRTNQPGTLPGVASPVLPFHGDVHMDGQKVGSIVLKRNQRAGKQTTASRRGPFAGQRLALG